MDSALSVVGGLFLAYHGINFGLQVIQGLRTFVFPALGFKNDLRKFGSWAVVTGSTDGIGKSYAKQLAKQGINIVLISRNLEKLQKVAEEIRSEYNVETRIIVMDFSGGPEIYQDIGDKLKDLEIGILVNNVGVGINSPDYFLTFSQMDICKMINVNILSVVMMTHIILPMMVARESGIIINVSSLCGAIPCPLMNVYSPTKVFVDFFSRCLLREYSDKGIFVQCVMPAFVSTNMTKSMKPSMFIPVADDYASQAIETIGLEPRTCGYWSHSLMAWIFNLLPITIRNSLIWKLWSGIREKVAKMRREKQKKGHKD